MLRAEAVLRMLGQRQGFLKAAILVMSFFRFIVEISGDAK